MRRQQLTSCLLLLVLSLWSCSLPVWSGDDDLEVRRWDRLELVNGKVFEGELVAESPLEITFRQKSSDDEAGIEFSLPRSDVRRLLRRNPPEAVYKLRLRNFDPSSFDLQRALGLWCQEVDLEKNAISHLEDACRLRPQVEEIYDLLIPLYDARAASGIAVFDDREIGTVLEAIRSGIDNPWLRKRAVDGLLSIGDRIGAILILEEISAASGDGEEEIAARARLAVLLQETGKEEEARRWARRLRESGAAGRFPGVLILEARWLLGDRSSGDLAAGAMLEERVQSLLERDASVGEAHLLLGSLRLLEDRVEESIAEFKKAFRAGAVDAVAAVTFALAFARSGDSTKALELISAARTSERVAIEWRLVEVYIQENLGQYDDALLLLEDILASEEASWQARILALTTRQRLDPDVTIDGEIEKILLAHGSNDSAFAECSLHLGDMALRSGDISGARRWLEYALRAGSRTPETWLRLALAQRGPGGDDRRALEALDTALKERPDDPDLLNALGDLRYRQGDLEGARKSFDRVVGTYPRKMREEEAGPLPPALRYAISSRQLALRAIEEELWIDNFDRNDGAQVLNNWIERETFGIDIGLLANSVRFDGVQRFQPDGLTMVVRPLTTPRLSGIRATMRLRVGNVPVRVALRIEDDSGTGLILFRDRDGIIGYTLTGRGDPVVVRSDSPGEDSEEQKLVKTVWPADARAHTLEIRLGNDDKSGASIYFDGSRVARKIPFRMRRLRSLNAGVSTQAELDVSFSLDLERFEVFRRKARSDGERQY